MKMRGLSELERKCENVSINVEIFIKRIAENLKSFLDYLTAFCHLIEILTRNHPKYYATFHFHLLLFCWASLSQLIKLTTFCVSSGVKSREVYFI